MVNELFWFGLGMLAVGFVFIYAIGKEVIEQYSMNLTLALKSKAEAEEKYAQAEAQAKMAKEAIEANSLPWFPKTDKLEARFEADAVDQLDNPEVSYKDLVEGLGGTK